MKTMKRSLLPLAMAVCLLASSAALPALMLCGVSSAFAAGPEAVFLPDAPVAASTGDYIAFRAQKAENPIAGELLAGIMRFTGESTAALLGTPSKNLCYSPLSLYYALLLAAGGTRGAAQAELYAALGLTDAVAAGANPAGMAGALYRNIHLGDQDCALIIAHAVWLHAGYSYNAAFLDTAAAQYGELYRADFGDAATAGHMSHWVAEKTRGLLNPPITTKEDQRLAIFNTVYLKTPWLKPVFSARRTFTLLSGREIETDFLRTDLTAPYGLGDGYAWARLPLEGGLDMTIVLPDEDTGLLPLLTRQGGAQELISPGTGYLRKLHAEFPQFAFDTAFGLETALYALGVRAAFSPAAADFSGLADGPVYLTAARQDTHITVDKTGIEAAALTQLFGEAMAAPGQKEEEPIRFIVNRPFFFCIAAEGIPLFVGVVLDPGAPAGEATQSAQPLALSDFQYFPHFQIATDNAGEQDFRFPGLEVVTANFGQPIRVDEDDYTVALTYPFGDVALAKAGDTFSGITIRIDTDALAGPRGIRVGDSLETLLAAFQNDRAGEALDVQNDEIYLYQESDGAFQRFGSATFIAGELVTVDYNVSNSYQQACWVSFEIRGGMITQIRWDVYSA